MMTIRRFRETDAPVLWTLAGATRIDATDPNAPLPLPPTDRPAADFADLAEIAADFLAAGGEFLVAEVDGHLVGMGGVKPPEGGRAEIKRVRVHPAVRRKGVARALAEALESWAAGVGVRELHLDTLDEAVSLSFWINMGYREVRREQWEGWAWTTVYLSKALTA
ncbi:MAG TPA: GNAT family N-acetyltransferase [Candidatus Limnocylindrales bacterium]